MEERYQSMIVSDLLLKRINEANENEEILNVDESNYNNVTVIKDHLTLDDYKIIYASIKIK